MSLSRQMNDLGGQTDLSGSVEIIALDTLRYRHGDKELEIFIERNKIGLKDEIFVDLAACKYWNIPKDLVLTADERQQIAKDVRAELLKLDVGVNVGME